ncbi:hypothetical protein Aple_050490 [Acrocarpospora pleiomorpha]|uniref:Uncharacterized protein n=1 Tax=Acrocarpospora pleiomorpha TaxID=90975 RepID=A0A5M3XMM4_9ACTN|nr:hypothetical protein Aple_050490 [Acrocarpospora pleiomorpha]
MEGTGADSGGEDAWLSTRPLEVNAFDCMIARIGQILFAAYLDRRNAARVISVIPSREGGEGE